MKAIVLTYLPTYILWYDSYLILYVPTTGTDNDLPSVMFNTIALA